MTESAYYQHQMDFPIETPPETVVSLVPSMTETLFDLNLGDRLIGITDYCVHPAERVNILPRIGGTKNPDVRRIIEMQPELVIANQEENRKADVLALREAGIPVWVTFPKSVTDVFNLLWNIMYFFEETAMVARVRLIEQTYDWVLGMSLEREETPCRVFAPIWYDPLMTFNQDTYMHDLLRVCGGTNVFAHRERRYPLSADLGNDAPYAEDDARAAGRDTRYPRVSWEEVAEAQPDVILLPSEPFAFSEQHLPAFAALDVPAARNGQIHLVDGSYLTWHGTRIAYALNTLPALLCPLEEP